MEQQKKEIYIKFLHVGVICILLGIFFTIEVGFALVWLISSGYKNNTGTGGVIIVWMLAVGILCIGGLSVYLGIVIRVIQNYRKDKSEIINLLAFIALSVFIFYKGFFEFLYKLMLILYIY